MIDGIPNRPLYFYQKDIIGNTGGIVSKSPSILENCDLFLGEPCEGRRFPQKWGSLAVKTLAFGKAILGGGRYLNVVREGLLLQTSMANLSHRGPQNVIEKANHKPIRLVGLILLRCVIM